MSENIAIFTVEECEGTLIEGTHNVSELIHAFLKKLEGIDITASVKELFPNIPEESIEEYIREEGSSEDSWRLFDILFEELDARAPEGYYFGTHPSDGADFGFWKCEE